ncbi:uncharacterized protein LOC133501531 isoform X2 [Syngnathoides biaculeatus]|uniref:uncharacterized protein LOC133501531 isoform X2 n=1 Tax=Syngnathoides biaculeatus TaxID=300417 RepID=UPI002ADD6F77|nr:uncharacterized protein LOC133501531 isoform X2 [Syngnathoides biaculeatus]
MSSEVQRPDDSPSTSGGSSDIEQRESSVPTEQEREQAQPKKKETKISSKTAAKLSTSAKRIQKELAEITLDPPPNCRVDANRRALMKQSSWLLTVKEARRQLARRPWRAECRPQRRQHLRVEVHHLGTARLSVRGRGLLPGHRIHTRLPLQAPQGDFPHSHLPLQHQQPGCDLSGHPEGQLEPRPHHLQGAAVHLLPAYRL